MSKLENKVSIIIPCYKQANYLAEAIESALNQSVPCEVIVVNDGSPDDTDSVAGGYFDRLYGYVKQENRGLSAARNAGIRMAETEWIVPLDSDDILDKDYVKRLLQTEGDIKSCYMKLFGDQNGIHQFMEEPKFDDFRTANRIHCASMFRKNMWEDLGGYDEEIGKMGGYEDWDFWYRATKKGYSVKVIPEILFYYRKHGKSMVDKAIENHSEIHRYILTKDDNKV